MNQAVAAGTIGIVVVDGDLDTLPIWPTRTLTFTNDCGGTAFLPKGKYLVRLNDRGFHDYETGAVLHGNLIDENQIDKARVIGITGYKPSEELFDPSYVRFHYHDGKFGSKCNFYPLPDDADPKEFAESCD